MDARVSEWGGRAALADFGAAAGSKACQPPPSALNRSTVASSSRVLLSFALTRTLRRVRCASSSGKQIDLPAVVQRLRMSERCVRRGGGALQGLCPDALVTERNECVLDVLERAHDGVLVAQQRLVLAASGDLVDRARAPPVEDRHRQQVGHVAEACGAEIETVHVRALATEQCADEETWEPFRRRLPTSKVGRLQLRSRCEQIRAAFEELSGLSRLDVRNSRTAIPRLDRRRIGGLAADQHGDAVSRGSGQRLERRYRCARALRFGAGALDIEGGSEPDTLSCGHETKRLVLSRGDRAYCFELLECADEREVVGRNIAEYQQAHTPRMVFSGHPVRRCSGCTGPQSSTEVDFPRNAESAAGALHVRNSLLRTAAVVGALITAAARPRRSSAAARSG